MATLQHSVNMVLFVPCGFKGAIQDSFLFVSIPLSPLDHLDASPPLHLHQQPATVSQNLRPFDVGIVCRYLWAILLSILADLGHNFFSTCMT